MWPLVQVVPALSLIWTGLWIASTFKPTLEPLKDSITKCQVSKMMLYATQTVGFVHFFGRVLVNVPNRKWKFLITPKSVHKEFVYTEILCNASLVSTHPQEVNE